ncbi:1-phosphofructokinase [Sporohalobacter salinus]|uniref:1-phosphofructokinase n=1 Tax=Sporohalobacter salinus TaxID=1494606 RepID=UPI0019613B4E|nr:1-phosphofructokinase [Sporohalobacter salinus]MBM7624580.1 tagatose 6-phosphate kinase [Sporohalobacter salinus]
MILTLTLNPAVDINYKLDKLKLNGVTRCSDVTKTAGGKGLNVSRVISLAGEDVCATGFLGGSNGELIKKHLKEQGLANQFVEISGATRNCIAMLHDNQQTEILETGPAISKLEQNKFIDEFQELLTNCEIIAASGSLPQGIATDFYAQLVDIANQNNKKFILDTSGQALKEALPAKPYLIKPNQEELEQLFNQQITKQFELITALEELKKYKIPIIVISLGAEGLLAADKNKIYKIIPPQIDLSNPVGSGDATIAGFAVGLKRGWGIEEVLKYGCTLGTLNAREEKTGYINSDKIEDYLAQIKLEVIKEL